MDVFFAFFKCHVFPFLPMVVEFLSANRIGEGLGSLFPQQGKRAEKSGCSLWRNVLSGSFVQKRGRGLFCMKKYQKCLWDGNHPGRIIFQLRKHRSHITYDEKYSKINRTWKR